MPAGPWTICLITSAASACESGGSPSRARQTVAASGSQSFRDGRSSVKMARYGFAKGCLRCLAAVVGPHTQNHQENDGRRLGRTGRLGGRGASDRTPIRRSLAAELPDRVDDTFTDTNETAASNSNSCNGAKRVRCSFTFVKDSTKPQQDWRVISSCWPVQHLGIGEFITVASLEKFSWHGRC